MKRPEVLWARVAEDQAAPVPEPPEHVAQFRPELQRQDPAAGDVVAVGEAAGDAEDLVVVGGRRPLRQRPHVHTAGDAAGPFKGVGRLLITVGAWGTQHQSARREHLSGSPGRGSAKRRRVR